MIRELNHVGIRVCDVDAAIKFYAEDLGGAVIRNSGSLDGKSRFVYIQIGATVIELITAPDPSQQGFAHVAFLVDDMGLDASYEKLAAEGYTFTVLPKMAGSGDGRLAFFKDDSGVVFELIERKESIRKPAFATPMVESFDSIAVNIQPAFAKKCDAFYTQEMGFTKVAEGRYAFGEDVLVTLPGGPDSPTIDHIAFKVKCVDAARKALEAKGYAPKDGPGGTLQLAGEGTETIRFFQA